MKFFVKAVALFSLVTIFTACDKKVEKKECRARICGMPVNGKPEKGVCIPETKTDGHCPEPMVEKEDLCVCPSRKTIPTVALMPIQPGNSRTYPAPIRLVWGALSGHGRILVEPIGEGCYFIAQNFLLGNPSGIQGNDIAPYIFYGSPPCQVKVTRGD